MLVITFSTQFAMPSVMENKTEYATFLKEGRRHSVQRMTDTVMGWELEASCKESACAYIEYRAKSFITCNECRKKLGWGLVN